MENWKYSALAVMFFLSFIFFICTSFSHCVSMNREAEKIKCQEFQKQIIPIMTECLKEGHTTDYCRRILHIKNDCE